MSAENTHSSKATTHSIGKDLRLLFALGLIASLSGLFIVSAYQITAPKIAQNRAKAIQQAALQVLPGAVRLEPLRFADGQQTFIGFDSLGQSVGFAIEASGQGFADLIKILYGCSPDGAHLLAFKVLESKETPGLGDKIEKDAAFIGQFAHKSTQMPFTLDGITGATISSKAMAKLLNASLSMRVPEVARIADSLAAQGMAP